MDSKNLPLPKVNELTPEEEKVLEENIVWLFGTRRSGTTWLGKQLLSYNTEYLHEPDITSHLGVPKGEIANDLNRRIDSREHIDNYFFSKKHKNTWNYYLGKLIKYRIYASFNNFEKKIIVKEPSSVLDVSDILSDATPLSKAIIILRDGRDVIDSLFDARQSAGWLTKKVESVISEEKRLRFIKQRARMWVEQIKTLMKTYEEGPSNLRYLVKYEDLRYDTVNNLEKIYDFLGIEIPKEELEKLVEKFQFEKIPADQKGKGKFFRSAQPGKWKETFDEKEKKILDEIMGETLRKVGYE